MSPLWTQRWAVLQERLSQWARSRGGRAERLKDELLLLHAPARGSCIRVWLHGEGVAEVSTDLMFLSATWALTDDDDEDLEDIVKAMMDGRGTMSFMCNFKLDFESGGSFQGGGDTLRTQQLQRWQSEPFTVPDAEPRD